MSGEGFHMCTGTISWVEKQEELFKKIIGKTFIGGDIEASPYKDPFIKG